MERIGHTTWVFAGGHIPFGTIGSEPEFTSRDELSILNAGDLEAQVSLRIYYADRPPVGPYTIAVAGERIRVVRINDLIDPEAVPLDTPYALVLSSDRPVVVQLTRLDARRPNHTALTLQGFADN